MAAATILMPRANAGALLGSNVAFANEWFNFFSSLRDYVISTGGDAAVIQSILDRLTALEGETLDATILGVVSVQVVGTLESGLVQIQLLNDTDAPGNTYYYGTDATGVKGWHTVASAFTEGAGVTLTVGADGVTDVAHADTSSVVDISANFTGGTVPEEISLTFDTFGHVLTRTITGRTLDHNDTGALQGGNSTERYHFTAAEHTGLLLWAGEDPADYSLITQAITNGDTTHSPSGDAVFDALATKLDLAGGTMTGNITVGTDIWRITANTTDGSDTRSIIIDSGVNLNPNRGAYIRVNGNEASSNPGSVLCISGNGADIIFSGGTLRPNADNLYSFGSATFRWSIVYTHQLYTHGKILFKGSITPTALAANTDNWAPTGYSDCSTIRASASAPVNLTGIQGGEDGKEIKLMNIGANTITLIHDLTSTAANRFLCPNNTSVALRQNGWVTIIYDGTSSRWRVMGA